MADTKNQYSTVSVAI